MAIRASSAKQIDALIGDLGTGNAVAREAAVARLTLLGTRAVERLIAAAGAGDDAGARAAAWRALEAIGDVRALDPALAALASRSHDPSIGAAAAGVARSHLRGPHGARALDGLASAVLDRARHETVRMAALRTLMDLEPAAIAPILATLADDPSKALRLEAAQRRMQGAGGSDDPGSVMARAAEHGLPDDPQGLRHALSGPASAPLQQLLRIVERVREREAMEPPRGRDEWRLVRAAAHVALASRGSRLAVYDLRESLEGSRTPLPVEFLTALSMVGDESCLEPIAAAHGMARDGWWRTHLAEAFTTIVAREKLTRRHAVLKKIEKRWPGAIGQMGAGKAGRAG